MPLSIISNPSFYVNKIVLTESSVLLDNTVATKYGYIEIPGTISLELQGTAILAIL